MGNRFAESKPNALRSIEGTKRKVFRSRDVSYAVHVRFPGCDGWPQRDYLYIILFFLEATALVFQCVLRLLTALSLRNTFVDSPKTIHLYTAATSTSNLTQSCTTYSLREIWTRR